ncbi:hypothetical protein J3R83DRAFT_7516 [Lanmaoa asiatica]|nr:hypothetical protein J3R83DRAFT_7473 [Lanmaoa asiatica]KAH0826030.1 hypothetical protein J3R83DRAFT_7516 [Lanmaoa asiatica]
MLARTRRSSRGGINGDVNGAASTPPSDSVSELKDVQAQFESHEAEMNVDAEKLREDVTQACEGHRQDRIPR